MSIYMQSTLKTPEIVLENTLKILKFYCPIVVWTLCIILVDVCCQCHLIALNVFSQTTKFLTLDDIVSEAEGPLASILTSSISAAQLRSICDMRGEAFSNQSSRENFLNSP